MSIHYKNRHLPLSPFSSGKSSELCDFACGENLCVYKQEGHRRNETPGLVFYKAFDHQEAVFFVYKAKSLNLHVMLKGLAASGKYTVKP